MNIPRRLKSATSRPIDIGLSCTVQDVREWLAELEEDGVPPEATLNVEVDYDTYPDEMYFTYETWESDEEYEARLKKEHYEQRRLEDDEKAMYKILKAKFEGDN